MAIVINGSGTITGITAGGLPDDVITTDDIADNAITLAKMVGGTDGQVITYSAAGDPVAIGPGTAGQVLTSAGANLPQTFAAAGGGAWTVITSTNVTSAVSTVDFTTGIDGTYVSYVVTFSCVIPNTTTTTLWMNLGDSSGFDTGSTDYKRTQYYTHSASEATHYSNSSGDPYAKMEMHTTTVGGSGGPGGVTGMVKFTRPTDGVSYPMMTWELITNYTYARRGAGGILRLAVITVDRIRFLFNSGNIASGRFTLYGIAHE